MRPLMLHGHERAITQIKYNRDGDLLFSVSKDTKPTVWFSVNGERLGTYNGHNGTIWCIDVNRSKYCGCSFTPSVEDSTSVLTGSADNSVKLWDCETGRELNSIRTESAVRTCGFSSPRKILYYSIDEQMRAKCTIFLNDVVSLDEISMVLVEQTKVTAASWGPFDNCLITGHENGAISQYDLRNKECIKTVRPHTSQITDLQPSKDRTMLITSSKDTSAKLYDSTTLEVLKTYKTERPVNSAAISPLLDHVVLGGGQEAMEVTTTTTRAGKFDARFYHMIFEEEIGRVKGHFGPINSLAFHPNGKSYSSGGEDGYVRVHNFDQSYFDFKFEY